jgi:hypothetical protein
VFPFFYGGVHAALREDFPVTGQGNFSATLWSRARDGTAPAAEITAKNFSVS